MSSDEDRKSIAAVGPVGTVATAPTQLGVPSASDEPAEPGRPTEITRLGRFEVRSKLGTGGMGEVWLATDPQLGRRVALKVLRREIDSSSDARRRLLREAQGVAQLAHDNVIVVYEVGTHDGQDYIAMEYVAGSTLTAWQAGRPWQEVVEMYVRAGRGLAAAHDAGLVHRDFKPDNVLVGDDGRVRVSDFGLVATIGEAPDLSRTEQSLRGDLELAVSLTRTGAIMGTPRYMAAEQHLGQPVDARADQFAFCAALYEALYGRLPFVADSYSVLAARVLEGRIEPIPADHAVPAQIRDALLRGLARKREERFPSMRELLAELVIVAPAARRGGLAIWVGAGMVAVIAISVAGFAMRARNEPEAVADAAAAAPVDAATATSAPALLPPAADAVREAQEGFDVAQKAYAAGNYDEAAIKFLDAYVAKKYPQFLYNVAASFHMKSKRTGDPGAYANAVKYYRRYLRELPEAVDRVRVERAVAVLEEEQRRLTAGSGSSGSGNSKTTGSGSSANSRP